MRAAQQTTLGTRRARHAKASLLAAAFFAVASTRAQAAPAQIAPVAVPVLPSPVVASATPASALAPAAEPKPAQAQKKTEAAIVTNGAAAEIDAARVALSGLQKTLASRDANALRLIGIERASTGGGFDPVLTLTHLAVAPSGALARVSYALRGAKTRDAAFRGTRDLWLARSENGFVLSDSHWNAPDDAAQKLLEKANESWQRLAPPAPESADARASSDSSFIIDLVAQWRGGRWIPLRVSLLWNGALLDRTRLRNAEETMLEEGDARLAEARDATPHDANPRDAESAPLIDTQVHAATPPVSEEAASTRAEKPWDFSPWLRRKMRAHESKSAGVAHFLLQSGRRGWVGLDSAWESDRAFNDLQIGVEEEARRMRAAMRGEGFLRAETHRDFGLALMQLGVFGEGADQLQKAEKLQPEIVSAAKLREAENSRARDPQRVANAQVEYEKTIGLDSEHPDRVIPALKNELNRAPNGLTALRLGLEYSRIALDDEADTAYEYAQRVGPMTTLSPGDRAWAALLAQQLQERRRLASSKPPTTIRSKLFTVRCWPNNLSAVRLLAGLEAAQHTIYADFGVPMSNTEVVLWRTQSEFQAYTSQMTGRHTSEFVTALTLTQLVNAGDSPKILGEEMVFYIGQDADTMSTIAHEYGHIAVRLLARGRLVPDWLNEGIATSVEGGYKDAVERVRRGARAGTLLSMDELRTWNVDGERAFLAYSQANSMIDFIQARWGKNYLLEIVRLIGKDVTPENAVRRVLQLSTNQLWDAWRGSGIK